VKIMTLDFISGKSLTSIKLFNSLPRIPCKYEILERRQKAMWDMAKRAESVRSLDKELEALKTEEKNR
jgi:hypothetical protein